MAYTWIPFYKELAEKLLQYKNNRSQLVEWIKTDLTKVKAKGGHSLINHLKKNDDFNKQKDIDPFTVFEIFNREYPKGDFGIKELLWVFHDKFNLTSDVPSDFEGLPHTKNICNTYLGNKSITVSYLWEFYEKILHKDNISDAFDYLLSNGISINDLTTSLYWIDSDKYLPLNDSNIRMLQMHNISSNVNTFKSYEFLMKQVYALQASGDVPYNYFYGFTAYSSRLDNTDRIWMWRGNETTFHSNILECGSDINGKMKISSYGTLKQFTTDYQRIKGNKDNTTPPIYWDFIHEANPGEIIVVFSPTNAGNRGHLLYGWGKIVSQCEIDYQKENPLRRSVEWHTPQSNDIQKESLTQNNRFFHSVNGIAAANILKILNIHDVTTNVILRDSDNQVRLSIPSQPNKNNVSRNGTEGEKYCKSDFLSEVFISQQDYEKLESLLLRKRNLILQGAPGVGKTFTARRLAYALMGEKDDDRVMQVQFHQNYSYEDFVMGYKPNEEGGFELKKGLFYRFCKRAATDSEHKYFFIIDEINRGNLSKIFGELLMLIENDYRDKPIRLSYSDELFAVPKNLYFIGMMNTADRSLAMIDYALRRRFSFFEMKPGFESPQFTEYVKSQKNPHLDQLVGAIIDLNKVIEDDDSLGSGFCIGHSYLCNLDNRTDLNDIVEYDIVPMLREYWFDNNNRFNQEAQKLRGAVK